MTKLLDSSVASASQAFPFVEVLCLLVLILITVFRKKLSSNDAYRIDIQSTLQGPSDSDRKPTDYASKEKGRRDRSPVNELHPSVDDSICLSRMTLDDNILLNIVVYLCDADIAQLSFASKSLFNNCTSDFIWEQLWIVTFGTMWNDANLLKIKEARGISWNPCVAIDHNGSNQNDAKNFSFSGKLPSRPSQGWLTFYKEFEFSWMDWLLAGYCTTDQCLIGLYGSVYDITNFLPEHPGSSESLTEAAGGDGTDIFSDIGHSSFASNLADMFLLWGAGEKATKSQEKQIRSPYVQRQYVQVKPNRFQVRMKRDRFFAERLILRDNLKVRKTNIVKSCDCPVKDIGTVSSVPITEPQVEVEVEGDAGRMEQNQGVAIQDRTANTAISTSSTTSTATSTTNDNWPLGLNLNLSHNLSRGLDQISSSLPLSLPLSKSVLSIAESVFLANAKATNFLRRSIVGSSRLRDTTGMQSMVPGLFKFHQCLHGCKHTGRLRMFYNPIELQWWGWWTCCGLGELAVDIREEESLCIQISDQDISYKIC